MIIIDNVVGQRERANNRRPSNLNTRLWTVKQFRGWWWREEDDGIQFVPKPKTSRMPKSLRFSRRSRDIFPGISQRFRRRWRFDPQVSRRIVLFFFFPPRNQFLFFSFCSGTVITPSANWIRILQYDPVRLSNWAWNRHQFKTYIHGYTIHIYVYIYIYTYYVYFN